MNFYRTILLLLILVLCKPGIAQTEHYLGVISGKVTGPIYTLQHNRWSVTAIGGWLTGFKGGYASALGGYELLHDATENLKLDVELGLLGQGYSGLTPKQLQLAKELRYDAPFGMYIGSKVHFRFAENWTFGMYTGMPVFFTETENGISKKSSTLKLMLYTFQLSLQYKLKNTNKNKSAIESKFGILK